MNIKKIYDDNEIFFYLTDPNMGLCSIGSVYFNEKEADEAFELITYILAGPIGITQEVIQRTGLYNDLCIQHVIYRNYKRISVGRFVFSLDKVEYQGILYPTSEHAYQAAKTEDIQLRRFIATRLQTPNEAKRYGQTIKLRPNWEQIKVNIMKEIVWLKFQQNEGIRNLLICTDGEQLFEGNTWGDNFWGVDLRALYDNNIVGENHLGKILMEVRSYFINEALGDTFHCLLFLNTLR
jgi:ribA/ribD-fused uncharacterized protein